MDSPKVQSWTLISLLAAFVDLCLAYFLLCGSLLWWFYSNLFKCFGLSLPCPCTGFMGYVNSSICVHKVFVEMPIRKIYCVQGLIRSKYPFSHEGDDEGGNFSVKFSRGRNSADGFLDLNGEVIPVKGKALLNQKQRSVPRRRRVSFGNGKLSPVSPLKGSGSSVVDDDSSAVHDYKGVRSETAMRIEYDEQNFPVDGDVDDTKWHGFEQSESFGRIKSRSIGTDFDEHIFSTTHDNQQLVDNDVDKLWILKKTLDEVNAAHSALCLELEKERAAAASAADEAIAMIIRLQEEKASVEMVVWQNRRMVEEKIAYDEEEMNILKEILIRKERENLFLENEVEAYKQMMTSGDENLEELWREDTDIHPDDNLQHIEDDGGGICKNEIRKGSFLSNCELAVEDTVSESHSCDRTGKAAVKSEERGDTEGLETQQVIYDVHVVEDTTEQKLKRNEKVVSMHNIFPLDELINFDCQASTSSELHTVGKMQRRNSVPDFGKSSLSDISLERSRLDSEVGWLREMLRILQEKKEKLKLSSENEGRGKIQIKLLEEIRDQLQEIQYLREPPPKKNLKERRSQSAGLWENPRDCNLEWSRK